MGGKGALNYLPIVPKASIYFGIALVHKVTQLIVFMLNITIDHMRIELDMRFSVSIREDSK